MRKLIQWMAAWAIAVGSLAIGSDSRGAVVTLNWSFPPGGAAFVPGGGTGSINFNLPSDLLSINKFTLTVSTEADPAPAAPFPAFGNSRAQFFIEQDTSAIPGRAAFAIGETVELSHAETKTNTFSNHQVSDSSAPLTGTLLSSVYNFGPLDSGGLWDDSAGGPFSLYFGVLASEFGSSVSLRLSSATLTLDYNPTGGGVVPEPSMLAIALVGLAGWRGRRMLRRS
jgi:hypothetical protein